jgi:hypothetical protein
MVYEMEDDVCHGTHDLPRPKEPSLSRIGCTYATGFKNKGLGLLN